MRLVKLAKLASCGLLVSGCAVVSDRQPSEADVIILCTNAIHAYAHARDAGDGEAFGALFKEDAVMRIPGGEPTGREAIVAAMKTRAQNGPTAHLVTSVAIGLSADGAISANSQSLVVQNSDGAEGDAANRIEVLVRYSDKMVLEGDACLFAERAVSVTPLTGGN